MPEVSRGSKPLISELGIKGKEVFLGKDIKKKFIDIDFTNVSKGLKSGKGRRFSESNRGKRIGDRPYRKGEKVDIYATLLMMLRKGDLQELRSPRYQEPKRRLVLILLDASDSMEKVIEATRKAVVDILKTGYISRDEISLIYFQGRTARMVIKPTRNAIYADEKLKGIRVRGSTPLAAGFKKSLDVLRKLKDRYRKAVFVLVSDGNPNISETGHPVEDAIKYAKKLKEVADERVFINPSPSLVETSRRIAEALGARYIELKSEEKTKDAFEKFLR